MPSQYQFLGCISVVGLLLFFVGAILLDRWCVWGCDLGLEITSYALITVGLSITLIPGVLMCIICLKSHREIVNEGTPLRP